MTGPSEVNPRDMMRGIENVGPGWRPLVRDLETRLMEIDPDYTLQQVKEKFGGLRYYASSAHRRDDFNDAIAAAEDESFHVCEVCGTREGVAVKGPFWLKALCPTHHQEREGRRRA